MFRDHLYQVLEFHRVLDDLAGRTHCSCTAQRMRELCPLSSTEQVQTSLHRISELRGIMDSGGTFPMGAFYDVRPYLETASVDGSLLEIKAFSELHKTLRRIGVLHRFFKEEGAALPLLKKVTKGLKPNRVLADEIAYAIDLQSLDVRDQASAALGTIRREMGKARERVRKAMERLLNSLASKGVLQERLITVRSGRWVLPVKESHRHMVKGVLHDKSASGATAFMEPLETLELNNRIRRLEAEERHEVEKVLRLLTGRVGGERPELEDSFECLVRLDACHAMALASKAMHQHAPALSEKGDLVIKNGRHPLLVLKQNIPAVPLHLFVGDGFNTLVITGPNAGGKTVALKTVGLLALMTACGLHIPADADSEIPVFNRIFVLVGDAQSIEMNLSTFSAHLGELTQVVNEGRQGDLVLIDEIGSGTDPQEGAALAMAILEVLTARGIVTIVTTHHGALKAFAHRSPGVANGSMAFDSETLTPTYAFRAHIPGSSYALEIARRLGIPEEIVSRSKEFMGAQANKLEELILELEQQIERNEALKQSLVDEKGVAEKLRDQLESQRCQMQEDAREVRQGAVRDAEAIVKGANAAVEKAIRTIREKRATTEAIRTAKALIKEEKKSIEKHRPAKKRHAGKVIEKGGEVVFRPGLQVSWERGKKTGTVLEEKDHGGPWLVAFGDVKIYVPREELRIVQPSVSSVRLQVRMPVPTGMRSEIDLRGMRVDEALPVADKFLSDAMLAGLEEVKVIHGIGTGILRKNIVSFLKEHPLVDGTVADEPEHVNPGMTVVRLVAR